MNINDDGCVAGLTNVKRETVIHSFRWKDNIEACTFTSIKGRIDELVIRRLDLKLKLWNLGMKFSRGQLNSWILPQHVFTWGQLLVSYVKSCSILANNGTTITNNTLGFQLIVNHNSNVVTIAKKDNTARCQFHRGSKGGMILDLSWNAASPCLKCAVLLLKLGNSHLGTPYNNLGCRKSVLTTKEMLNWKMVGCKVFCVENQENSILHHKTPKLVRHCSSDQQCMGCLPYHCHAIYVYVYPSGGCRA